VVKRLVELHGGSIEVASAGLRQGAIFTVRMPLAAAAPEAIESTSQHKVVPMFKSRPHILVVDDNRDAAETLAEMLRTEGFPVAVAFDGASALAMFGRITPAVVLLDMGLPDLNGTEVTRQMRRLPKAGRRRSSPSRAGASRKTASARARQGSIFIWSNRSTPAICCGS